MIREPRLLPTAPIILLRHNQQRVMDGLRLGRYDAVWESRRNCFDDMVAFMVGTGVFCLFGGLEIIRQRDGIPDDLMLRVLLASTLLRCGPISDIPTTVFADAAVLRFLGFTIQQIEEGFNRRGGPNKQLPFSHETLYDLWARLQLESIDRMRAAYRGSLLSQRLIRGSSYVIDGSSIIRGKTRRGYLPLLNIRGGRELVVDYRLLEYSGDIHDSELTVSKEMVRDALQAGVQIKRLTVDRAYVDGAWMWELAGLGIDLMVRVREDMRIFEDLLGHGRAKDARWQQREIVRKIEGRKVRYRIRLLLVKSLDSWDSYKGELTGLLVESTPLGADGKPAGETQVMAIVTPREYSDPWVMWREWRRRWRVENTAFHELKEGYLLEKALWGDAPQAVALSVLMRTIAYNTSRLYTSAAGQGWTIRGLRALQREVFDAAGMFLIIEAEGEFAILTAKEFAYLLGKPPRKQRAPPGFLGFPNGEGRAR